MDEKTKQEKLAVAREKSAKQEKFVREYDSKVDFSLIARYQTGCTQEENDLLLEDFNNNNRQKMLKELPDVLYVGIYMTQLATIQRDGLGIEPDHTKSSVELCHSKSYATLIVQRCSDEEDRECPFCHEKYYGVVAIATKNLDLNNLSYLKINNTNIYVYEGGIEGKYIKLVD